MHGQHAKHQLWRGGGNHITSTRGEGKGLPRVPHTSCFLWTIQSLRRGALRSLISVLVCSVALLASVERFLPRLNALISSYVKLPTIGIPLRSECTQSQSVLGVAVATAHRLFVGQLTTDALFAPHSLTSIETVSIGQSLCCVKHCHSK